MDNRWNFNSIRYGGAANRREEPLVLYWHLDGDSITDDYLPEEASASELFESWAKRVEDDEVSILWLIESMGERAPFTGAKEDFLTFYTWPTHAVTGNRVSWVGLPIKEKGWNERQADKGGFIQEALGWQPSPLQPSVSLRLLLAGSGWSDW